MENAGETGEEGTRTREKEEDGGGGKKTVGDHSRVRNVLERERTLSTVLFAKEVFFSLVIACIVVAVYALLYIGAVWNPGTWVSMSVVQAGGLLLTPYCAKTKNKKTKKKVKYTERIDVIIANDDQGFDVKRILHVADSYLKKLDAVSPSLAKQ